MSNGEKYYLIHFKCKLRADQWSDLGEPAYPDEDEWYIDFGEDTCKEKYQCWVCQATLKTNPKKWVWVMTHPITPSERKERRGTKTR